MTLQFLPLVIDLFDGSGAMPQGGLAAFTPTAVLTDAVADVAALVSCSPILNRR